MSSPQRLEAGSTADRPPDAVGAAPGAAPGALESAWVPTIAALLAMAPVLVSTYPPMTDLPHHEALVALLRTRGDTSRFPPGFYTLNLGHPNQLFHLLAWPLTYLVAPTLAAKLVAALSVGAVPWGTGRLARHLGASPSLALLAVPIALGWLMNWGFVNNLLGLGLLLALLPGLDRFVARPTPRGFASAVAAGLVLYSAHELLMFVYVGACGLFSLVRPIRPKETAARLGPAAVCVGVSGLQIVLQEHLKTTSVRSIPDVFTSPLGKLTAAPVVLVGGPGALPKYAVFALWLLAGGALVYARHARWPLTWSTLVRERASLRFVLLGASIFGLYLAAPYSFNGAQLVHQRFLAPAALVGLVALAAGPAHPDAPAGSPAPPATRAFLGPLLAWVVPVAMLLVVWPDFVDSSVNYDALERLLAQIPKGAAVAVVDVDQERGARVYSVTTAQSRVLARSGGRVLYSLTDSTVAPVRIAPPYQWSEPSTRIMPDNLALRPAYDLTRFGSLLVHASRALDREVTARALEPFASLVDSSGEWSLFRSRLSVVPITAPEGRLPAPAPHTLRYLFRKAFAAMTAPGDAVPEEGR